MTPSPVWQEIADALRCRLFGHRWTIFHAEQCPLEYRACKRCDAIVHACNTGTDR